MVVMLRGYVEVSALMGQWYVVCSAITLFRVGVGAATGLYPLSSSHSD